MLEGFVVLSLRVRTSVPGRARGPDAASNCPRHAWPVYRSPVSVQGYAYSSVLTWRRSGLRCRRGGPALQRGPGSRPGARGVPRRRRVQGRRRLWWGRRGVRRGFRSGWCPSGRRWRWLRQGEVAADHPGGDGQHEQESVRTGDDLECGGGGTAKCDECHGAGGYYDAAGEGGVQGTAEGLSGAAQAKGPGGLSGVSRAPAGAGAGAGARRGRRRRRTGRTPTG